MTLTQVQKTTSKEESSYLSIKDFLHWAEQHDCEIPEKAQERLLSFSWLKDTRALKCLFGSQLSDYLGLTEEQLEQLAKVFHQFSPVVVRSLIDMEIKNSLFFSTGSKNVNQLMRGGIETGHLYEFAGPAASGKTQICYATALSCYSQINDAKPGNSVLWIDAEHSLFPTKVLKTMEKNQQSTNHIFKYIRARTLPEFLQALLKVLYYCQSECNLRLIIIDSLIAPIDRSFRNDRYARAQAIREILGFLKEASCIFSCAFIITNQVRGPISDDEKEIGQKFFPLGGFSFAHATENRFLLEPLEDRRRKIKVLDSSYLPPEETSFYITKEGIADTEYRNLTCKKETSISSKGKKIFN